ncbi:hypothetical protein C8J57DRAFT_1376554 [Mycena rebaudengoi]|nr:hypothetical protein C8J57DRAFT_1376554 [Mycena rebaudengoi]
MHRTCLHARLALLLTSCMDDGVLCTNCPRCYSGGYRAAKHAVEGKKEGERLVTYLYVPSPNPLSMSSRMSPVSSDTATVSKVRTAGQI